MHLRAGNNLTGLTMMTVMIYIRQVVGRSFKKMWRPFTTQPTSPIACTTTINMTTILSSIRSSFRVSEDPIFFVLGGGSGGDMVVMMRVLLV